MLNTKTLTWDDVYPVGSIYMSVNAVNPGNLFGGDWVQIKDTFLLACGDTFTNGAEGGSVAHTPSGTLSGGAVGNHTLTVAEMPSHTHPFWQGYGEGSANRDSFRYQYWASSGQAQKDYLQKATGGDQPHNHPFTQPTFTGEEQNTMPPYLAVYIWKRIA